MHLFWCLLVLSIVTHKRSSDRTFKKFITNSHIIMIIILKYYPSLNLIYYTTKLLLVFFLNIHCALVLIMTIIGGFISEARLNDLILYMRFIDISPTNRFVNQLCSSMLQPLARGLSLH